MSKVQGPKSETVTYGFTARERLLANTIEGDRQDSATDLGPWTLDFGLTVDDLRKSFSSPNGERVDVLRGVSFSASPGKSIAITGRSGAGKSTLLHLLGGIEPADHGSISLGRFVIEKAKRLELAQYRNEQVGFVFQFHHLLPDLTAVENVSLPLLLAGKNRREANKASVAALESVGLADRASHPITDVSGGEQQRIAVCRALITQPVLVLADEPTGNLDAGSGEHLAGQLLTYARARPAIVIIATHNQDLASSCDRMLMLREGRIADLTVSK